MQWKFPFLVPAALFGAVSLMAGVSPGDAKSNLSQWLELFGLPSFENILTPSVDNWVLGIAAFLCLLTLFVPFCCLKQRSNGKIKEAAPPFDTPIREAVDHYIRTFPHSYRDGADQHAFEVLHKAMCSGKLPVVGTKGEDSPSERISARRCKRLKPIRTLLPKNWASPQGVRFDLVRSVEATEPLAEPEGFSGFTGLRVRSADLYRLWPKNQEASLEGIAASEPTGADSRLLAARENPGAGIHIAKLLKKAESRPEADELLDVFNDAEIKRNKGATYAAYAGALVRFGELVDAGGMLISADRAKGLSKEELDSYMDRFLYPKDDGETAQEYVHRIGKEEPGE